MYLCIYVQKILLNNYNYLKIFIQPRKVDIEVEVEVLEVEVEGMYYYKTRENVLLDIESYEIVGMLKKDKIEKYF